MSTPRRRPAGARWVEPALSAAVMSGIAWCLWCLFTNHYLPQPFLYDKSDTFGDWFNTATWARDNGAYDSWSTVYPPLSFVFLRLVGVNRCYSTPSIDGLLAELRVCDWVGFWAIWLIFALNVALVFRTFYKLDPRTSLPRTICVGLGMPMLDGLERGNLMLITFTCLVLALGPILRSARLRWVFAGLAVNFKIYLIAAIVPLLLKRRWRWVECALISVVLVYMCSYAILGHGTPLEILSNVTDFSSGVIDNILDIWHATTYGPLLSLLTLGNFPASFFIGSHNVDRMVTAIPILEHATQIIIVAGAAAAWVRPEVVPTYRVINLGLLLAMTTQDVGMYSIAYFMFFVMMESWRGIGRRWAIVLCYVLALPLDIPISGLPSTAVDLYFGNYRGYVDNYVVLSPFIRPLIIMIIAVALSLTTIVEVWKDIRFQGWAGRWRLRGDAPLLPGVRRPTPWIAE